MANISSCSSDTLFDFVNISMEVSWSRCIISRFHYNKNVDTLKSEQMSKPTLLNLYKPLPFPVVMIVFSNAAVLTLDLGDSSRRDWVHTVRKTAIFLWFQSFYKRPKVKQIMRFKLQSFVNLQKYNRRKKVNILQCVVRKHLYCSHQRSMSRWCSANKKGEKISCQSLLRSEVWGAVSQALKMVAISLQHLEHFLLWATEEYNCVFIPIRLGNLELRPPQNNARHK